MIEGYGTAVFLHNGKGGAGYLAFLNIQQTRSKPLDQRSFSGTKIAYKRDNHAGLEQAGKQAAQVYCVVM